MKRYPAKIQVETSRLRLQKCRPRVKSEKKKKKALFFFIFTYTSLWILHLYSSKNYENVYMWLYHSGRKSSLLFLSSHSVVVTSSFLSSYSLSLLLLLSAKSVLSQHIKDHPVFSIRIFQFKTLSIYWHNAISECLQKHQQPQQLTTRYISRIIFSFEK